MLSAAALFSCTGAKLAAARSTVSAQSGCPEANLAAAEVRRGWYVTGCETRYFCRSADGPCVEDPTQAQQLSRARQAFSRETACPLPDVTVQYDWGELVAQGCGRYSVCASYDGPCMPSRPPTCAEVAQKRHDYCVATAREAGAAGRNPNNYIRHPSRAAAHSIAGAVLSTVAENRLLDECRAQHDAAVKQCGSSQQP